MPLPRAALRRARAASCARSRPRRCRSRGSRASSARPRRLTVAADGAGAGGSGEGHGRRAPAASARVRVIPPLPWSFDFEAAPAKRRRPLDQRRPASSRCATTGGGKVLVKLADNPVHQARPGLPGPDRPADYTVEADVLANEQRRQMGDGGVIAQRYVLVLFGNTSGSSCSPGSPNPRAPSRRRSPGSRDTWYRLKLRVENLPDGKTARARQGLAGRRARARGVDARARRPDRPPAGQPRASTPTPRPRSSSTTSRSRENK